MTTSTQRMIYFKTRALLIFTSVLLLAACGKDDDNSGGSGGPGGGGSGTAGSITSLNCTSANQNGTLTENQAADNVTATVTYSGSNGGSYNGQAVESTGITGLTATLAAGIFAGSGAGSLTYSITGTPSVSGIANFALDIGGQNCILSCTVNEGSGIVSNPGEGVTYAGYNYPTVVLGNGQEWMAENLNSTQYNDGTPIPVVADQSQWSANFDNGTTLPMMSWHSNDQATYTDNKFGALYNWHAVSPITNGNRNICPTGWHVPSDAEWSELINYLDPSADGGNTANIAGGKMKSTGAQYWLSPNKGATNESGFSGLPGGARGDGGGFSDVGGDGFWWSSTEFLTTTWVRYLYHADATVSRYSADRNIGFSVRCIKD